ncbi:hypothetical protein [Helicobacter pylori]|uniref:Poly E-rich protein n=1 Tax=Helicobacter pylori Aklavik86 TaxID=1055532 RepID=K7Y282_HELPX|nr:hypothetical protein [Helicobacter pylori]AFX89704.1 poly E-rich protein [Helicobacter pylori Aklavik86]WQS14990.1 hypothetical protein KVD76_03530 [Helicobacter pylori]WQS24728.1 hypothetical protein KVD61_03545 [Helicobacter pylori]
MKIILFSQNPMIKKLLESVSKKLELPMESHERYEELSTRLKENPEWLLIADDECLEKLDQADWLELKEIVSQNKNSVCMYKKGNEAQPFLEGFEMKIKKPFLPTEMLKVLQKKLGFQPSESDPNPTDPLEPAQETLETNWDELENLGDLETLAQEEPNNEEQLLPTLNDQEEKEEAKEEIKETPQEEEKPKEEMQEQAKEQEPIKEETQEEIKEETQEEIKEETQEEIKEETQEELEIPKEETQEQAKEQELEAMQELVKEIQENSNNQADKEKTQENAKAFQETQAQELEKQELEIPQESTETPQEKEKQALEIPQEEKQENAETPQESTEIPQEKTQKLETQEDHYESIEDIPEPVMAQAMGEALPFLNESVAKTPNNENDTEIPKESVIKTPQEKEGNDKTSSPLELRLNLQDLLKSLNQESLKSLLENKTLSIKITLEDKKPDA